MDEGVDGSEPPLDRFEDIAARYVQQILSVRQEGPYVLGGYSVGGRIALEVALQLQAMGKPVSHLIIFDMFAPGYPQPLPLHRRILEDVEFREGNFDTKFMERFFEREKARREQVLAEG